MQLIRRATLALAALVAMTGAAHASEWKIDLLSNQLEVIPKARELNQQDRREFLCLSLTVFHEAASETPQGQTAVAYVVVNRRNSGRFGPPHICSVVSQPHQFTWTARSTPRIIPSNVKQWEACQRVALAVLANEIDDPSSGALYFNTTRFRGMAHPIRIGRQVFSR